MFAGSDEYIEIYDWLRQADGLDESTLMLGVITHFLVECPSRPLTTAGDILNEGAVCMPYYDFNDEGNEHAALKKENFKSRKFPDSYQWINSLCHSSTKVAWAGDTWVWYDTCPLGKSYYPIFGKSWENPEDDPDTAGLGYRYTSSVQIPCSGRGVCKSDGTWVCRKGFLAPNWEVHCSSTGAC
jgi:hypothetical protein